MAKEVIEGAEVSEEVLGPHHIETGAIVRSLREIRTTYGGDPPDEVTPAGSIGVVVRHSFRQGEGWIPLVKFLKIKYIQDERPDEIVLAWGSDVYKGDVEVIFK